MWGGLLFSVSVALFVELAFFPFLKYVPGGMAEHFAFVLGTAFLITILEYSFHNHWDLFRKHYLILKALKQCHLSTLVKARMVIFILFQTASDGAELKFSVTVEEYIKLLAAAIKLVKVKGSWYMTYTLPLEHWHKFGKFASEYNDELKSRVDIQKVRFAIPPDGVPDSTVIDQAVLIADSVAAGVEVHIYDKSKLEAGIEWDDFALADDTIAIVGGSMPKDSSLRAKVTLPRLLYHYILEYPALIDSASTGMPVEKFSVFRLINSSGVRFPSELCGLAVL